MGGWCWSSSQLLPDSNGFFSRFLQKQLSNICLQQDPGQKQESVDEGHQSAGTDGWMEGGWISKWGWWMSDALNWFYWWFLLKWRPFQLVQVRPSSSLTSRHSRDPFCHGDPHDTVLPIPPPPPHLFFFFWWIQTRPPDQHAAIYRFSFSLGKLQHINPHVHTRACEVGERGCGIMLPWNKSCP